MSTSCSCVIIFICHNNETIDVTLKTYPDSFIMFVGHAEIKQEYTQNTKIIIARDLEVNIENNPKLLTYTAWFAITTNNLFNDIDYVCLLEYDVVLEENFKEKLKNICETEKPDIVSFKKIHSFFLLDIDQNILNIILNTIQIKYDTNTLWFPTTNHCIKREILDDFVKWYYPISIDLWYLDRKRISWYHERLFSVYLDVNKKNVYTMDGLFHFQKNSHHNFNAQNGNNLPIELIELYCKHPSNSETISKIEYFYSQEI